MAWVKIVDPGDAGGLVKEVYERNVSARQRWGEVAEITKVFSLRPDLLAARETFANTMTFGGSGLGRYREELIAVSISALLGCKF